MNRPASSPLWHPFTQHALRPRLPIALHAQGSHIVTADGRRIIDAISSWWVITHGHRHPRIVEAVREQASRLDQVIFAEFSHEPAEQLAEKLLGVAPREFTRVFLSDSGSTSVEVALKMALGYWHHRGERRHRIIVMEHSYHGDTVGTMSVGARSPFTASFEPLLFEVGRVPFPHPGAEHATFDALERHCANPLTAAFIVEPLILGAGGMLMYGRETLAELKHICTRHGVLFVADEVMTGWGRTGELFACDHAGLVPDIACYSKGLTGGLLPLAATLCREEIYQAFYAEDRARTFFHSSSFTGNPIACAAALANLEIWEQEPVRGRIAAVADLQRRRLDAFKDDDRLANLRQCGTITAFDLKVPSAGYLSTVGPQLHACFLASNVLLRPLGNVIYVMPPYCISEEELDAVYDAIRPALDRVMGTGRLAGERSGR